MFIWLDYFLETLLAAYKEFEQRVGLIRNRSGNKSYRVESRTGNKECIRNFDKRGYKKCMS